MRRRFLTSAVDAPRSTRRRFVDRVRILTAGGDGGKGCASMFRDANVAFGPPNGGNGGNGGDVVLRADHNVTDLQLEKKNFKAASGTNGMGSDMHGARGETMELRVPCGTLVERLGLPSPSRTSRMEPPDAPRTTLAELLTDGDSILVARGGRGGRGNASFRQGLQQHARIAEDGGAGEAATLLLSLKLIADVGLVGFPNAGKSSLLRALSNAVPKVAPYPFTTLHPHLGRVRASAHAEFTLADIPGLVDGAHANRGLGHSFLRHIERTSLLCYVLDLESEQPAISQLTKLQRELELYLPGLGQRPCLLVANKADVEGAPAKLRALRSAVARLRAEGELPGLIGGDGGAGAGCGVGKGEGEGKGVGVGVGEGEGEGEGVGVGVGGAPGGAPAEAPEMAAAAAVLPDVLRGSAVTAVSAKQAGNLRTLVLRMHAALGVAKRLAHQHEEAAERQREAERRRTRVAAAGEEQRGQGRGRQARGGSRPWQAAPSPWREQRLERFAIIDEEDAPHVSSRAGSPQT
jgi:GTPase